MDKLFEIFKSSQGVVIDSRNIRDGQIFFAFKGEKTDGHKYVEAVLQNPNCYCVIEDAQFQMNDRAILVDKTLNALQELARKYRDSFDIPVIAITGSNGKTTTKELLMAVLQIQYKIHVTQGNFNNHIGVPLTLLSAPSDAEMLIVEMGANKLGDIDELCHIAYPTHGLITNIGTAHVEGFGSESNILKGKTELYKYLEEEGVIFLNKRDDKLCKAVPENTELVLYPDENFEIVQENLYLKVIDHYSKKEYLTQLYGMYNALNIQAALAVAKYFDVKASNALQAIAEYKAKMNRSQIEKAGSSVLIMDAYNANPSSMKVSIANLDAYKSDKKKVVVLGDMLELGEHEVEWHKEILGLLDNSGIQSVYLVGPLFKAADINRKFEHFEDTDELLEYFKHHIHLLDASVILLKASRSMHLEKLSDFLQAALP